MQNPTTSTTQTAAQEQVSQLVNQAHQLAAAHTHTVNGQTKPTLLNTYLPQLLSDLDAAYHHFTAAADEAEPVSYAAEWLLDNYYIIQQAFQHIQEALPDSFYNQLPKLNNGLSSLANYPRIYVVARSVVIHESCQLHQERLKRFLQAYQEITPLTMGELWAWPIMLRFVLLESIVASTNRLIGREWAQTDNTPPLMKHTADANDIVAAAIPSLRRLAQIDWNLFFEEVSLVEQILRQDPAAIYAQMDFNTRDQYRKVVEELALVIPHSEATIAEAAVSLAKQNTTAAETAAQSTHSWAGLKMPRTNHVGYYLLDQGYQELQAAFRYTPPLLTRLRHTLLKHPTFVYLGPIFTLTTLIIAALLGYVRLYQTSFLTLVGVALMLLIPAMAMAVSLTNWLLTNLLKPTVLPKLDFSEGIPATCQTMVVIPALLSHPNDVDSLFNQLELHYQRNPDPHLSFALLTDFADAPHEKQPEDKALITQAIKKLDELNERYPTRPFYFFHRQRLWNQAEGSWMGWERKRGKLHEFNQLLRGRTDTTYYVQCGHLSKLTQIQYVITLDADTILSREAAPRLVGTLAHPLNQAQFDPQSGRVTAGYTILQPRTEIKPTSGNQSLFTRVFAGDTGLDLYTRAVSDVYQDLFGEGTYVGKGIYQVDDFERSLAAVVPENSLLSHDLFEGIHGRAGLVTDIILYEDYPSHYLVNMRRSHRWIRGDWQLLPWLAPLVPSQKGYVRNQLPLISLWKIIDNLRRSLMAPALLLLLVLGWAVLPGSAAVWTLFALLTPAVPLLTSILMGSARLVKGATWLQISPTIRDSAIRWLLFIAFIPNESILVLNAVLLTLYRLFVSRKKMLQWTSAAETSRLFQGKLSAESTFIHMVPSFLLAITVGIILLIVAPASLVSAAPLLLVWVFASEIAYWIGRPDQPTTIPLTAAQQKMLRTIARRTWLFYERFVGPEDNWIPPDHFQESPRGVVAHRTSPTNVGLYLLSMLAAYDFGYISLMEFNIRLRSAFDTLDKLERYAGHFLNWIDTSTLAPLNPRYISTVDSGNLAGCLLALEQGCLEMAQRPLKHEQHWLGLLDTLNLLEESLSTAAADQTIVSQPLEEHLQTLRQTINDLPPESVTGVAAAVYYFADEGLPTLNEKLIELVKNTPHVENTQIKLWRIYTERIHNHVHHIQREYDTFLPWLMHLHRAPVSLSAAAAPPALHNAWAELTELFAQTVSLETAAELAASIQAAVKNLCQLLAEDDKAALDWCQELQDKLQTAVSTAQTLHQQLHTLAHRAATYVAEMDFSFLYNKQRQVFHIGYNLDNGTLDGSYYDLLASEARIASIVAIAKNEVPLSHWLHLGRPLIKLPAGQALLSWSGTMFEYLMPPLLMRNYAGTLLSQSITTVVDHHISYGQQQKIPWGISESGYYAFDASNNYQYYAFGVPGLGLKRRLGDDQVITPYASLMALAIRPQAVMNNIAALKEHKMYGQYGFYEALDFTPARLPLGRDSAIVRSYMAHHQGMIMLALANHLLNKPIINRFHANPTIQSVELLLQERIPAPRPAEKSFIKEELERPQIKQPAEKIEPWSVPAESPFPLVHYLSNGRLSTLITNAGSGYTQWGETALTRWRADTTQENWGCWLYVQDIDRGALWSAARQPTLTTPDHYQVEFYAHKVSFQRRDHDILLQTEITVPPTDEVEIRLYSFNNSSDQTRHLRLTSYGEVVLTAAATDERHPAFAKLFIESEYLPQYNALLFRRRPRSAEEAPRYLAHFLLAEPELPLTGRYESDRAAFLGRGGTIQQPAALTSEQWLSGRVGATLDPIMALGQELTLPPRAIHQIATITLAADSRAAVLALIHKYWSWGQIGRALKQAEMQAHKDIYAIKLQGPQLAQIHQLLSLLMFPHAALRAPAEQLAANQLGQSGLWSFGISGDYPILLLHIKEQNNIDLLSDLLKAHIYWRRRGLKIDLVLVNQQETNYGQEVQGTIHRLIHRLDSEHWLNRRGGIFVLRQDQMDQAQYTLLQTAARVVLHTEHGLLDKQLAALMHSSRTPLPSFVATQPLSKQTANGMARPQDLQFDNGWGGFSADGREYVIYLRPGEHTPAPWINVIANDSFGCLVSANGGGYSWAINSGENRLTSWRNDPVSDQPAEALYIRDEETAAVWSPTPQPAPAQTPYLIRHGAGYTIFEHHSHQLKQQLRFFIAPDEPVKIAQLTLVNTAERPRRLTVTYYAEWVLGTNRYHNQAFITPEYAHDGYHALLAHNRYNEEFSERVAFLSANKQPHGLTADRTEFIGRLGTLESPAALKRTGLQNEIRAGIDPCAVMQLHVDLPPEGSETVYFLLGQGDNRAHTEQLLKKYYQPEAVTAAWEATQQQWHTILNKITVQTPDKAMDLLLNQWLLYQALACRIWGRSALYQSSGAYGFRDQLQDVMSVIHTRPDLAREHLLRSARHQFAAGDVLHWWHPPSGRGVRTRITDDLVWLPYVTAHYVQTTGDYAVLNEKVPFLTGDPLKEHEEERYGHYQQTDTAHTLYEHCQRVLERATTSGRHGIPLMGAGDWNDGMNRVGIEGKGESIWLGWFIHAALTDFAQLCTQRGDNQQAAAYQEQAEAYRLALEENGWDGQWYRRAYFDDGTPLGSAQNEECQIDSIAQSWGVLSHAADAQRASTAMQSVMDKLVKKEERLILLFNPPFDQTPHDPGYIKGYLPGIRENGGQYTHAALWTIWAMAELGHGDTAEALYRLINPIRRADTAEKADTYKVEPYVIAADVYGVAPHEGRGGWTWYTGSSGWMYRLGLEQILGIRPTPHGLSIDPCIPTSWDGFTVIYHHKQSKYTIKVCNPQGVSRGVKSITLDGAPLPTADLPLEDDGRPHEVHVELGHRAL